MSLIALGELCERLVGFLFYRERLIEEADRIIQAKLLCPCAQCAVARDLAMLDRLRRGKQAGVMT
jgi:hypothetical protein